MAKKFAFIVHPRADVAQDMGRLWKPLGLVPEAVYDWSMRHLPLPPINFGPVVRKDASGEPAGWIIILPVGARQLLTSGRKWSIAKIEQAVDKAEALGAEVVGLGALTSPIAAGGTLLRQRPNLTITSGNAFTAKLTYEAIARLLPATGAPDPHIAFVGATGSVGSCVVDLAAEAGLPGEVTLVARNRSRLEDLATRTRTTSTGTRVTVATEMSAVRTADLVVLLTSAADSVLRSEHLKPGAVVLDDTQPRNTDVSLLTERPDVTVVDGGMAFVDGFDIRADIGDIPSGYAYACLCETMLLALDDHRGPFSGRNPTVDQAHHMQRLADRFGHLGFGLGDFLSFGRPTTRPEAPARLALAS